MNKVVLCLDKDFLQIPQRDDLFRNHKYTKDKTLT